jgi:hypothetical protein
MQEILINRQGHKRYTKSILTIFVYCLATFLVSAHTAQAAGPHKKARTSSKAKALEEPPIRAGTAITILNYDRSNRTLVVKINAEPAVGPNLATPEKLVAAIEIDDADQRRAYVDDPSRFVGAVYTLKNKLELVPSLPK